MASSRRGLPTPRVPDTLLQRWIESVAEQLREVDSRVRNVLTRAGLTDAAGNVIVPGAGPEPGGPTVPVLGIPPTPAGFDARAGVNLVMAWWDNPFTHYQNHALTRVFRHTADEFNNAAELGMSPHIDYVDQQVVPGDYWYWIRWQSTEGILGPVSDPVMVTVSEDPAVAIARLSEEILNDPLAQELLRSVEENEAFQHVQQRVAALLDYVRNTIRARALELERQAREAALVSVNGDVTRLDAELTALEARITGTNLGPEENRFTGNTRADAEAARDAYAATDPAWLPQYDADDDLNIRLTYGVLRQYQNRVAGAWVNNGEEEPTAAAVSMLQADTQTNAAGIAQNVTDITLLTAGIGGKADLTALQALTSRVSSNESGLATNQAAITSLATDIAARATVSAVSALATRVTASEGAITAQASDIANLAAQIPGLATVAALTALSQTVTQHDGRITANADAIAALMADLGTRATAAALDTLAVRVADNEDALSAQALRVTALEASSGIALGPAQNTFAAASKDAALAVLDGYAAANPAWFAQYRDNPENAVELSWN